MNQYCPQCGAPIEPNATSCKACGKQFTENAQQNQGQYQSNQQYQNQNQYQNQGQYQNQNQYQNQQYNNYQPGYNNIDPSWPVKNKIAAGLFGILLGGLGIHKFYLGKVGLGVVYLLFCWTGIPGIIGLIEGIIYLCSSDEEFMIKNQVRVYSNNG